MPLRSIYVVTNSMIPIFLMAGLHIYIYREREREREKRERKAREKREREKRMAMHSSTLAWRTPWTEEPGGLQSLGSHS